MIRAAQSNIPAMQLVLFDEYVVPGAVSEIHLMALETEGARRRRNGPPRSRYHVVSVERTEPLAVMFTSGSSGRAKGVVRNLADFVHLVFFFMLCRGGSSSCLGTFLLHCSSIDVRIPSHLKRDSSNCPVVIFWLSRLWTHCQNTNMFHASGYIVCSQFP